MSQLRHNLSKMATSIELSKSGGSLSKKMDTPSASGEGSTSTSDAAKKRMERMKKLRELNLRRNEARKMNHQEVIEEDKRNKRPANWEARQRRVDWELQEEDAKKAAAERGEDYDRVKMLQTTADELDRLDRKKKKKNPDEGFSDYSASQYRQYQRLTKQMKPDLNEYKQQKEEMDESELYPTVDNVSYGGAGKVSEDAVDRMVNDLEKQIEKRAKYSRRQPLYDEAGIDFINERNMKFNKKLARFYDPFTAEIKQNLERGTAV